MVKKGKGRMKEDIILPLIKGKRVLDCGGADHSTFLEKERQGVWLHGILAKHAASILGVDILQKNVDIINASGKYTFICKNVEELEFTEEFDVVFAGELIEHLYNPGRFLSSARRALKKGGLLILTTPNAYNLSTFFKAFFLKREGSIPEHMAFYSPQMLRHLVANHDFTVSELHYINRPARLWIVRVLRDIIIALNPLLCETIVLVAKKPETAGSRP